MPLYLFYTMVQKSRKWPKLKSRGGPALKSNASLKCKIMAPINERIRKGSNKRGIRIVCFERKMLLYSGTYAPINCMPRVPPPPSTIKGALSRYSVIFSAILLWGKIMAVVHLSKRSSLNKCPACRLSQCTLYCVAKYTQLHLKASRL